MDYRKAGQQRSSEKKKDPELAALCIKIKTVCSVYFHSDRLNRSRTQLVRVSHAAHIFTALTTKEETLCSLVWTAERTQAKP